MARRRRELRPEERELWNKVARTAAPMHSEHVEPRPVLPPKLPDPGKSVAQSPLPPRFRLGQKARSPSPGNDLAPTIAEQLDSAPLSMDRKSFNRMRRGKLPVDARLDLHGMTMADAHPRLNHFILESHARGFRLVLVITGKGKSKDDYGPIPQRIGVLKHHVPQWLRNPMLHQAVLQVTEAHQSHGGAGAYYVYLRRRR